MRLVENRGIVKMNLYVFISCFLYHKFSVFGLQAFLSPAEREETVCK